EGGLRAATSRRIAEVAGVNLAAITYYFGSKDALVAAALDAELERLVEPAMTTLESDGDPGANLLAAVQQLLATFAVERDRAPTYLTALLEAARAPDDGTGRSVMQRLRERIAAVVRSQVDTGQVVPWVEPDAMAALIIAAANGIVLQVTVDPDGPTVEETATQFALLLMSARSGS
ncbi:MAG: TetR family transcriptional regulator, partial [Microthrixaceae bacterium]